MYHFKKNMPKKDGVKKYLPIKGFPTAEEQDGNAVNVDQLSYQQLPMGKCPLVYSSDYNINPSPVPAVLLQQFHPFDAQKWGNVHNALLASGLLSAGSWYIPTEASRELLRTVHSEQYLQSLRSMQVLSRALELPLDNILAAWTFATPEWADERLLRPMRLQAGGTMLAAELALDHGWAINIGGGFHHASAEHGSGFCVYADISIALYALLDKGSIQRAMIVDLDAHQGNGHGRDFLGDERVYIMDMYNAQIYPGDVVAFEAIRKPIQLLSRTGDQEYMAKLKVGLQEALAEFPTCGLLLYNAGTDLLHSDRLGQLNISEQAVIARDQLVFEMARQYGVPIVMVTSGGYSPASARVIANSILNMHQKGLIQLR